jgi:hypothetical protein
VAAPYFPPIGPPVVDTRFFSTGAPLFASESHSSTNSQFVEFMQVDENESFEDMNMSKGIKGL